MIQIESKLHVHINSNLALCSYVGKPYKMNFLEALLLDPSTGGVNFHVVSDIHKIQGTLTTTSSIVRPRKTDPFGIQNLMK